MSDERPWKLQLVCCGRDDGVVTCETRADAELTRSAYISAEGHDRQAILTGPPGAVETDPVALLGEYLGALGKGDWSETVCADMRALLEQVRTARNAATARAEQAEAALAEMRERHDVLGQTRAEIAIELRDAARWHPDNAAWTQDMDQAARIVEIGMDAYAAENGLPRLGGFILTSHCPWCGAPQQLDGDGLVPSHEHPVYFDECPGTHRRPADATPRTALERAADEQGVRCGAECGEGHTYEPGSCEAAIDPDEAIARNHVDAKRDWGIDEQGDGEGGGDGE